MKRRLTLMIGVFAALAAMLFTAGVASAGTVHPDNGSQVSASSSLGTITLTPPSSGGNFNATYKNTTGSGKYVDFNLQIRGGSAYGDGGAFTVTPGATRTYTFVTGTNGACAQLILYDRSGALPPLKTAFTC